MAAKPNWTKEELEFLSENYGLRSDKFLARHFNRSIGGIREKAYKSGITKTQNFLTASDVAEIFGFNRNAHSVVNNWLKLGYLKGKRSLVKASKHKVWKIEAKDLENFIKTRTDLFDPNRIDRALQPYWRNLVDRALPKDFTPTNGTHWSEFEDAFIINNRAGLTQAEMGKRIRRTEQAVHARLVLLKKQGRLLPYKKNWQARQENGNARLVHRWTAEEDSFLRENWGRVRAEVESQGGWGSLLTAKELGKQIGRSEQACWTRASKLGLLNQNWNKNKGKQEGEEYVA